MWKTEVLTGIHLLLNIAKYCIRPFVEIHCGRIDWLDRQLSIKLLSRKCFWYISNLNTTRDESPKCKITPSKRMPKSNDLSLYPSEINLGPLSDCSHELRPTTSNTTRVSCFDRCIYHIAYMFDLFV